MSCVLLGSSLRPHSEPSWETKWCSPSGPTTELLNTEEPVSVPPWLYFAFPAVAAGNAAAEPQERDLQKMYHVRGRYIHGFVVDPGAASGFIGTETFRKHKVANLDPRGLRYTIRPSLASFVGISGVSESGLGILEMPFGLEGFGLIYW